MCFRFTVFNRGKSELYFLPALFRDSKNLLACCLGVVLYIFFPHHIPGFKVNASPSEQEFIVSGTCLLRPWRMS